MQISKNEYKQMADAASSKSKSWIDIPVAFAVGGFICCIGQFLMNLFQKNGLDEKSSGAFVSISLVLLSAILTGFRIYEKIANHAGAGTLVPITGFANSVVAPAIEFRSEGYILGVGAKIFIICGPVILYGVAASFIYGIIYYFIS